MLLIMNVIFFFFNSYLNTQAVKDSDTFLGIISLIGVCASLTAIVLELKTYAPLV
jgi:hypothetical protein